MEKEWDMRHIETYRFFNEGLLGNIRDILVRAIGKRPWKEWSTYWQRRLEKADLKDPGTVVDLFRELTQNTSWPVLNSKTSKVSPPEPTDRDWDQLKDFDRIYLGHSFPRDLRRYLRLKKYSGYVEIVRQTKLRGSLESARALIEEASKVLWGAEESSLFTRYVLFWANQSKGNHPTSYWLRPTSRHFHKLRENAGDIILQLQVSAVADTSVDFTNLTPLSNPLLRQTGADRSKPIMSKERRKAWNKFILDLAIEKGIYVFGVKEWVHDLWENNILSVQEKLTGLIHAKSWGCTNPDFRLRHLTDDSLSEVGIDELAKFLTELGNQSWPFNKVFQLAAQGLVPGILIAAAKMAYPTTGQEDNPYLRLPGQGDVSLVLISDNSLKNTTTAKMAEFLSILGWPEWVFGKIFMHIATFNDAPTKMIEAAVKAYPTDGSTNTRSPRLPLKVLSDETMAEVDIEKLAKALSLLGDPGWLFGKLKQYIKTFKMVPSKVMAAARRAFPTEYDREFGEDDYSAEMAELGM